MVEQQKKTRKHASHHKRVVLRHHHHKPFRKRHVGLVVSSLVGLVVLLVLLVAYRDTLLSGLAGSRNFIADITSTNQDFKATISSTNGFSVTFNTDVLYANAVDGKSGKIYQKGELLKPRAYSKVQFTPLSQQNVADQSAITINYHTEIDGLLGTEGLKELALKSIGLDNSKVQFVMTEKAKIGDEPFEKFVWKAEKSAGVLKNLQTSYSAYAGNIEGHPFIIIVNEGFVDLPGTHKQYEDLIKSISFHPQTAEINKDRVVAKSFSDSVIDTIFMARTASAQSAQQSASISERIAALYSPAVVRVYNVYCTNIEFDDEALLRDSCSSSSGSGFFVSQDGHIATNGHVVSVDAQDIAIYNAFVYAVAGNSTLLNLLAKEADIKQSDIPSGATEKEFLSIVTNKLYELEPTRFQKIDTMQNLVVTLGDKKPNVDKLVSETQARIKYETESTDIVHAEVKATNFRLLDGIDGFSASDVAIIKVDGKNYPIVTLGSASDVTQGEELSILGYPGSANENDLVDADSAAVSLTTGKVSSVRKASGTENVLIETDTTIGHGNSGGPAFGNRGTVVGIATYTLDGSGSGDGVFNYIRDTQDLTNLAKKTSISFDTNSETQKEWAEGIDYFYNARYSTALTNFEKVQQLYPPHSKVSEFIATSKKRIANGEDIKDFPVELIMAGAVVLFIGVLGGVFLIVHHHKHHKVYRAGVDQGSVAPFEKGTPADPQHVQVSHPTVSPAGTSRDVSSSEGEIASIENQSVETTEKPPENQR